MLDDIAAADHSLSAYDLLNSAREPLHAPGSIQPYGVLLVARLSDLRVVYASANADRVSRIPAEKMLGMSLLDCFSAQVSAEIISYDNQKHLIMQVARRQFVASAGGSLHHFDLHRHGDFIYVEVELELIAPEVDRLPIQARMIIDRLEAAESLEDLLDSAVSKLQELTQYDRVMVYRFAPDGHGQVLAEVHARGMVRYKNLHFPATDIPAQARALHISQRIQTIPNARYTPVPVLRDRAFKEVQPLDMTYCGLRSASPVRLAYLKNMGVGATLVTSLVVKDQLWGLVTYYHRAAKSPSPELRSTCELVANILASLIDKRQNAEAQVLATKRQMAMEKIAAALDAPRSPFDSLLTVPKHLLEVVQARGALIRLGGRSQCIGETPPLEKAVRMMKSLLALEAKGIYTSNCLADILTSPDLLLQKAGGALLICAKDSTTDGILWFRPKVPEVLFWAGNPERGATFDFAKGQIVPRKRFDRWKTVAEDCCLPWLDSDLEAAEELNSLITGHVRKRTEDGMASQDLIDDLTMLPNRRSFEEKMRVWGENGNCHPAAVIMVSLDCYQLVDTALGRSAADDLVLQVARRVSDLTAMGELVFARLGPDEFAVLCTGCTAAEAQSLSVRISEALVKPVRMQGRPFHVRASVGFAHAFPDDCEDLLHEADTALLFAKRGEPRVVPFERKLQRLVVEHLELEQDLYRAMNQNEFCLDYQPIVTLPQVELVGFEALIRWNHPTRGLLKPVEFLPLAEEAGLMHSIGAWVLEEAIRKIKRWRNETQLPLTMYVNIAAQQMAAPTFVQSIECLLSEAALSSEALSVEVTEGAVVSEAAIAKLRDLREIGVGVVMDDFGTGYSCLASLRKLPIDTVKIDRSFIQSITEDARARDFVQVILNMTQSLGLCVITEGVETAEQRMLLENLHCTLAQGYLFSKPKSADEISLMIQSCEGTPLHLGSAFVIP